MKSKKNSNSFILIGVLAGLVAILDFIGIVAFPVGFLGASGFYIGFAFYTAFAIWFRWKGLLSIYIGLLIGALISGTFTIFAFVLALGNVIGAAIPMLFFSHKKINPELKTTKDYFAYVLSSTVLQNMVAAAWILTGFYIVGIMPKEAALVASTGWIIGDIVVSLIIGIPLLKFLTPIVKRISIK
jgi:hypothetical protein